ncbi:hypothetical protein ACA910_018476 [Epithemia clementina (nom. ined.)]
MSLVLSLVRLTTSQNRKRQELRPNQFVLVPRQKATMIDTQHCDDYSASSSATAEVSSKRITKQTLTRRKRVSFNERCNTSYRNKQHESADLKNLWYTNSEYSQFKNNLIAIAKGIVRLERAKVNKNSLDTYRRIVERLNTKCFPGDSHREIIPDLCDVQKLHRILNSEKCPECCELVGMEKVVIRKLNMEKKNRQRNIVEDVLYIQEQLNHFCSLQQPSHLDESAEFHKRLQETRIQAIALAAQEISRPACHLATIMAQAQFGINHRSAKITFDLLD